MTDTTNAVRQVLMNELGLTRESIREEADKIVASAVEKHVTNLMNQGFLERIVTAKFDALVRGTSAWGPDKVTQIVVEAAKKETEKFVRDHLRLSAE